MTDVTDRVATPVPPTRVWLRRRIARLSTGRFLTLLALVPIMAVIVVPIAVVAVGSLWSASFIRLPGEFTFNNYRDILSGANAGKILLNTLEMTLGASVLAVVLGGAQAWVIARTDVPWKSVLRWLPVTPLLLSALVANFGWTALYSPTSGLVNDAFEKYLGIEDPIFDIYSMPGLIIALGTHLAPIPYMILLSPLASMSRSLDEASHASGAQGLRTFWSVNLPLLRPALLSSFTLTAILASHAFETPVVIGAPAEIQTYVSEIYQSIAADVSYSRASAQAMIYLALIGLLLVWNRRMTKKEAKFAVITGRGHDRSTVRLGAYRPVATGFVLLVFLVSVVQLVAANLFVSLLPYYTANADLPPFTLENYRAAFSTPRSAEAMQNSLQIAATVAVLTAIVATFLSIVAYKTKLVGRRFAEEIGTLPVAFPPLVFSMAMLITFLSVPGFSSIYNSVYLLMIVLVIVFLPFALRIVGSSVIGIDGSLLEASASSGARMVKTIWAIILPLLAVALTGAFALVFIFSFRELGAIALITPPNEPLLPSHIYGLWTTGHLPTLYALNMISLALTVCAFLVLGLCAHLMSRRIARTRALSQLDLAQLDQLPELEGRR